MYEGIHSQRVPIMPQQPANGRLGRYVETIAFDEKVRAYVPPPLPPSPPIALGGLLSRLSEADRALGRLDGIAVMLPRKELFLYMYVRKEAVLSSQIEGTQSTLDDLLRFETEATAGAPILRANLQPIHTYPDWAMVTGPSSMALTRLARVAAR